MQKNVIFVNFSKVLLVVFSLIVLLLSIITVNKVFFVSKEQAQPSNSVRLSMYHQLKAQEESQSNVAKMNNLFFENSTALTKPSQNPSVSTLENQKAPPYSEQEKIHYPQTLTLLDTQTSTLSEMSLEDYVLCSLVGEMPQSFQSEALKAQAVACRTFAVRSAMYPNKHKNADICNDYRCCQSMIDVKECGFDVSKAKKAVDDTKGIIAVYENEPILAVYHASSYNSTKSSKSVWGGELSYLVEVASYEDKNDISKVYEISVQKVKSALKKYGLEGDMQFLSDKNGLCVGAKSSERVLSAKEIKNALSLRSDSFEVKLSNDSDSYIFTCLGYGHGVGMSQYGANALASQGYDFYEILRHYYTGIVFDFAN